MKAHPILIALTILVPGSILAQSEYDRHVAFDNSLTDRSYYYSQGFSVSPSESELVDGEFPVEEERCISPPNCLRLKWRSQTGGGSELSFWCYSDTDLSADESPLISLNDVNGVGTPSVRLISSLGKHPAQRWIRGPTVLRFIRWNR